MRPTLLLVALLLCFSAQAQFLTEQKNHISISSGTNLVNSEFFITKMLVDFDDGKFYDNTLNFEVNFLYERLLSKEISVSFGYSYLIRSYTLNTTILLLPSNEAVEGKAINNFMYLDVPIRANWYFYKNPSKGMYMSVTAGAQFSFLLESTIVLKDDDGNEIDRSSTYDDRHSKLRAMPGAHLGVNFMKSLYKTDRNSLFLEFGVYGQQFFREHIKGQDKYQFGLNVGVGMGF